MSEGLSVKQLVALHSALIDRFGGTEGIRDFGLLESAAARPFMTFGGEDLYPDLAAKAAALVHSLVMNHPFVDGNKRVGAAAGELFLLVNGCELCAADDELERFVMAIARGELELEPITIWVRQRLVRLDMP